MFKSINIKNFRSFKELKEDRFTRINLITGRNNCGKTSFLEALLLLGSVNEIALSVAIDNFRGLKHKKPGDFKFLFHGLESVNQIEISGNMEKNVRKLSISLETKEEEYIDPTNISSTINQEENAVLVYKIEEGSTSENVKLLSEIKNNNLSYQKLPNGKKTFSEKSLYLKSSLPLNFITQLDELIRTKEEKIIIDVIQKIDKDVVDISIGEGNTVYVDVSKKHLYPINIVGDGVEKIIQYIAALSNFKNGTVLIDEIENGLHIDSVQHFWKALVELSHRNNFQIFASTHSIDIMKGLANISTEESPIAEEEFSYFNMRKLEKETKMYRYTMDELRNSLENNIEAR